MQKPKFLKRLVYFLGILSFGLVMLFVSSNKVFAQGETVTVTYQYSDTGSFETTIEKGSLATNYDLGIHQGRKHTGWQLNSETFNFETPVNSSITLTATWQTLTYTFKLNIAGVDEPVSITGTVDNLLTVIGQNAPEAREGHKFSGWFFENTYENAFEDDYDLHIALNGVGEDLTVNLYGKYIPQKYLSIFNFNGTVRYVWTVYEEEIEVPDTVLLTGYTLDSVNPFDAEVPATMPASTLRFVANYVPTKVNITFQNDNEAQLQVASTDYGQIPEYTEEVPVSSFAAGDPHYHYIFVGWTETLVPATSAVTYTAKYQKLPYVYQLTLEIEDETYLVDFEYGAPLSGLEDPTPPQGYAFSEWNNIPHDGNMPSTPLTLTAVFVPRTDTPYTVRHLWQNVTQDGYVHDTENYPDESATGTTGANTDASSFVVADNHFTSSYTDVEIAADGSTIVEIKYDREVYTITFNFDGGTAPNITSQDIPYEGKVVQPAQVDEPTKQGYTFGGWLAKNDQEQWVTYDFNTNVSKSFEIKAKWEPAGNTPYKVEHLKEKLDGQYERDGELDNKTGQTGGTTVATPRDIPNFTVQLPITQKTIAASGDTVVEVYYTRNEYTVSFNTQGGSEAPAAVTRKYQNTFAKPEDPTKQGYTFSGWATSSGSTTPVEWPYQVTKTETLYAIWTANTNTTYYVRHMGRNLADTGYELLGEEQQLTGTTGANTAAVYIEQTHFTPVGTDAEIIQVPIGADGQTRIELYYSRNSYAITFNVDGDKASITHDDVKYQGQITKPVTDPTKTGYTFKEWQLNNVAYNFETATVSGPTELVATWNAKDVRVSFVLNGGTLMGLQEIQYYKYNTTITNPGSPTKDGYTFQYWQLQGTTGAYTFSNPIATEGPMVLSAIFEKDPVEVTLTVVDNSVDKMLVFVGDSTTPYNSGTDTVYEGNTIRVELVYDIDLYENPSLKVNSNPVIITNNSYEFEIAADTTITFDLDRIQVTVTFNAQNSTSNTTSTIDKGTAVTKPADPSKEHHTFSHWSTTTDGGAYNFNLVVNSDMTLYAVYTPKQYTVTFNGESVSVNNNTSGSLAVAWGTDVTIKPLITPSKEFEKLVITDTTNNTSTTVLPADLSPTDTYNYLVEGTTSIACTLKSVTPQTQNITFNATLGDGVTSPTTLYLVFNNDVTNATALTLDNDTYSVTKQLIDGEYSYSYYFIDEQGKFETLEDEFTQKVRTFTVSGAAIVHNDTIVAWNYLVTGKAKVTINVTDRSYQYLPTDRQGIVYITGNIPGKEWVQADSSLQLTHGEGNAYSITLVLPKGHDLNYKYVRGSTSRDWELYEGKIDRPNRTITLSQDNEQTINDTKLKADPDESRREIDDWHEYAFLQPENRSQVTFNITLNEALPSYLENQVRIVGNIPLYSNWDRYDANLMMTKVGVNTYTITLELPKNNEFEYKFSIGNQWIYDENHANRTLEPTLSSHTIEHNGIVWQTYVNDTITSLEGKSVRKVTFTVNDIGATNMYITGNFPHVNWNTTLLGMSKNATTGRFEFDMWLEDGVGTYSYKYTKDSGTYEGGSDRTLQVNDTAKDDTWQN